MTSVLNLAVTMSLTYLEHKPSEVDQCYWAGSTEPTRCNDVEMKSESTVCTQTAGSI